MRGAGGNGKAQESGVRMSPPEKCEKRGRSGPQGLRGGVSGMRGAGGMRGPVELQAAGERRMRGVPPGGDAESGVYAQSGGG